MLTSLLMMGLVSNQGIVRRGDADVGHSDHKIEGDEQTYKGKMQMIHNIFQRFRLPGKF